MAPRCPAKSENMDRLLRPGNDVGKDRDAWQPRPTVSLGAAPPLALFALPPRTPPPPQLSVSGCQQRDTGSVPHTPTQTSRGAQTGSRGQWQGSKSKCLVPGENRPESKAIGPGSQGGQPTWLTPETRERQQIPGVKCSETPVGIKV